MFSSGELLYSTVSPVTEALEPELTTTIAPPTTTHVTTPITTAPPTTTSAKPRVTIHKVREAGEPVFYRSHALIECIIVHYSEINPMPLSIYSWVSFSVPY